MKGAGNIGMYHNTLIHNRYDIIIVFIKVWMSQSRTPFYTTMTPLYCSHTRKQ